MPEIKQGGDPITAPAGWTSYLQGQGASLQYTAPEFKKLNHYDKNLVSGMNQEYNRSDNQAWYQQVGNSLVGRTLSIAPKIGAGIGALYGIGDALTNQDVSKIWDNPVSDFFQGVDKNLSEYFANYKSQKYQEGNLLSKLATAGVVDDIFDGAAFLAAAYATGVPVMKGVGSGLESLTAAKSGADGLSKILKYIGGADELAGGITKTSQAATTIFNSFSEASVEAHQSMEELTKQYLEQDPNMSTEDARKKAAEHSTGVFGMNMLTLLAPNFIETRNLHGDFRTNIAKARQLQREGKETAELLQAGSKWSKIGTSAFSELSEENMQSAIQKYESQIAAGSKDAFVLENFAKNYIGFIKELLPGVETSKEETDAALAMFIGGLMGGGGAFKSHLNESARYAALPKELKDRYDSIIKNDVPAAQALLKSYQEQAFKKRGGKIVMDPVTGKPIMDKNATLNGVLNQTRNKSFFEASSAATVANDEALHDYNMEMATMAYAHDLATKYADPEDLKDHLAETAKLPHMVDSMAKVQEYIDLYSKVSTDTASVEDFSNEQDAAEFNYWFKSLNYYNQSKAKALEKLKLSAKPESIIAIDNLIKDVQETGNFIKKQRETLKEDFLMQYNPHVANVKKAQDPSLSAEARKAHTYLASEARVINEGWAGLIPNVNTPGLRFQNENELGRKAILEQAIAENPDSAVEEVYTYMDATQDSALPDSATDALYTTKQQVIDEITALEDQHRQLSDQEEQTIEESELEGDEYQALVLETATAANERLSEIYQAKGYVAELDKILTDSAKRKGVKVLSEDELKVKFFNQAVRDRIDSLYEHYKSNPNNFQESTTLTKFQEDLNLAREAYTMRTDMTSKDDVLDKIKELQSNLDEMYKQLEKNAGNRSLKQRLTVNKSVQALHSAINTPEVLAVVSKYLDPKEYLALQDSLDNDKHYNLHGADLFLFKLRDLLTEEDSKKLQGIFTEIATKYKDELFKELETTFGKNLVSSGVKKTYYLQNPDKIISMVIGNAFKKTPNDRIDEYIVDRDLDSLIIDLPHTTLSATEQAAIKKMYQLHLDVSALVKINNLYLNSSVDYMKVLEARALLYKDLKTTGVAPTFQQLLAINQIIESYFTKGANWSNAIVSLGTAGSGKSSVVAKSVVDILKKLDPKFNVYAIGHTEQSSSNINYVLGTKITTRQDFEALSAEKLSKIDLLIIDEIYGLKNADIQAIVSTFKNKILFLGDPAQSSVEANHYIDGEGTSIKATFVQPLTVVYRTNVPVIVEYFNKFRLRSKDVVDPSALVNLPKSEIIKNTSKAVGVLEATEEEILEALKTPSTRSRALVVSSKDQLEKYKDLQGVDVYMHDTIQGLTYDEVFTLIKKEHFNTTENFKIYNQAVFTATSRARFFIMTNGQNTKSIETPSITDNIEVASEEFAKNKALLLKELENASQFSKLLYSSSIAVGTPPAAKNEVNALDTDEEEDIDQDELDAHTQESVVEAETEAEDIETELPKTSTGEVGEVLEFPTNYPFSKGHGNLKEAHIKAGSEVYTIRVENNGTFEYHLVGISSLDGTPKSIAVLSENELTNNPLFNDIQSKGEKANKQVDKGRLERTSPEALKKASIKNFVITEATPATFSYNEPLTKNTNAIEDTLKKFIQDYFSTVPVPAGKSFFKGDGSLDWKALQDYGVRIVIFKKGAAQDESIDYANNQSVSKIVSGVPYIEFPTDHTRMKTSGKAKSFYIRLSANKFSKSSKYYAPIRAFYDTAKELATIDPKFSFESKDFRTKIANVWRDTFEVTESLEEGTVKRQITKKADAKSAKELFGIDNPNLDKLLDEFIQMTHGYAKVTYSVRDEEYEDFKKTLEAKGYIVKGKAPQSDKGTGKRFRIEIQKDPDDPESIEYYQTYVVSSTKSAVGQVLNGLANANSYAAGKALNSLTVQNGKVVKMARSIFEQDTANGFYTRWLKAAFIDAIKDVDDLKATPAEIANSSTNQSKEALLIKNGYLSSEELAKKKAEYSVPPINFARLEELVGDSSFDENGEHRIPDENGYYLREPLTLRKMDSQKNYYGVNHWGKSLSDLASRESLSELLGSRFSGFTPTRISVQSTTDAVVEAPVATPATVVLDDTYGPVKEALDRFSIDATFMSDLSMPLGAIQAVGNVIKYNLAGKPLPKDIVQHELIHVVTLDGMLRAHTNKGSEKDILLYKRVQELANIYRKKVKAKDRKLQSSPSFEEGEIGFLTEFIANLSNPEFKAQASKIKVADTTLLSAIWTAILDFLGVSPNVYDSLLATLIDYSSESKNIVFPDMMQQLDLVDLPADIDKSEYAKYLTTIFPKSTVPTIVWHAGSVNRFPEHIARNEYEKLKALAEKGELSTDKSVGSYAPNQSEAEVYAYILEAIEKSKRFDPSTIGSSGFSGLYVLGAGFYFGSHVEAQDYGAPKPYLINIQNPNYTSNKGFQGRNADGKLVFVGKEQGKDGVINDTDTFKGEIQEYVVFDNSQIYLVGSTESLKAFRNTQGLADKKAELIDLAQRTKDEETAEELEEQIKKATTLEELIRIEKLGFALIRTPKVKYTSVFGGINKSRYLSFKIPNVMDLSKEAWNMTKNLTDRLFDMSVQNPQIFEDFKSYWNVSETIGVNTAIAQSTEFFSFIMNSGFLDKSDRAYLVEHFTEDYAELIPLLASKEHHTDLTDAQVAVLEAIFNLPEILRHEDIIKNYLDNAAYNEIRLYRTSKEIMMNALNKVITPNRTNILTFKREQMNALENLIRSQRLDVRNIEDSEERNLMQDAYAALLSPAKGKGRLILHLMYSEVFPSFDHERKEEEDLIFERDIATKTIIGIKDYTQDKAHIDGLKSLSQEVKEALSYIAVEENGKTRWLNPAYTYITALELLSTVNLSRISTDPLRAQLNDFNLYSPAKQAVILKLEDIITNATRNNDDDLNPLAKNIQIFSSKLDVRGLPEYVGVHSGAGIRASIVTSVEEALKADPSHKVSVSPPFKTSEELYKWFQSKDSTLTIGMYNMILNKHESQNTLRELQNQLGSQKKTELFVASREYNSKKSGWEFRYIRAKDFGISFSIQATVLNALSEAVDKGQLQEAAGGLQIYFGVDSFNKLKSAAPDTKRAGIREIFEKMGLSSQKSAVLEGTHTTSIAEALIGLSAAYDTYWTTVDEEVARDEDGESTVSIDGKTATADFRSINDFIERKEEQGGRLTTIGLALEAGSEYVRSPSVVDSSGNKYFQYHPSSWSYFVIQDLIRSKDFKGSTGKQAIRLPDYLTTDYFSYNTFMKTMPDSNESISTIYELAEHDAVKQESINQVIPNQRESEKWFHHREFHVGFLSGLRTLNNRYFQYFSPPSDKPKVPVAQVKLLSVQNATEGIKAMIQQVKYSQTQAGTNLGVYEKSLKNDPFRNFNVLAEALPGNTTEDKLTQLATYNTDDELNVLTQAVMLRLDEIALEFGKREAELMVTNKDGKTSELRDYRYKDIFTGKLNTEYGVKNAADLHKLYIYNQYVNSYNVNQLVVGDYNMFKNSDDIIKRMAGVFGPGTIGLVHPTAGMKKNFTVAVIKDSKEYMFEGEKPTSVILRELLVPSTDAYKEAIKKVFEMEKPTKADFMKALHTDLDTTQIEDLEALFKAFGNKPYESTDGQGFMSVKRFNELNKGFGRAWKAGNIMKPMYYAVHKEDIVREDGTTVTVARPVYLKYSTVVLTDDLVARFPTLKKLKDKMESENGPDEILFESALKVGVPNGTTATFHTAHEEDLTSSTLTLSNEHYRLQHNPFHTTEEQGEVAIFTQLMYFLSMLGTNDAAAQASYEFVADIMNNQLGEWKNDTANLKSYIGNKLNAKGNERAYQLFKEAVSINNPLLEKKAITILASAVEKDVIKTKFSGSKLVLQSAEGISKYTDAELFNLDPNEAENLSFQIENGRLVAEAIVPRNMLTAAQLEMVKQKKPIFLTGDMLGYRIPSTELHSAVALRIVGVYDNVDTNMIIVPKEIVPIHGSDQPIKV